MVYEIQCDFWKVWWLIVCCELIINRTFISNYAIKYYERIGINQIDSKRFTFYRLSDMWLNRFRLKYCHDFLGMNINCIEKEEKKRLQVCNWKTDSTSYKNLSWLIAYWILSLWQFLLNVVPLAWKWKAIEFFIVINADLYVLIFFLRRMKNTLNFIWTICDCCCCCCSYFPNSNTHFSSKAI